MLVVGLVLVLVMVEDGHVTSGREAFKTKRETKRDSVMEFFRKGSANHPPPPILSYGTVDKHVILVTKI